MYYVVVLIELDIWYYWNCLFVVLELIVRLWVLLIYFMIYVCCFVVLWFLNFNVAVLVGGVVFEGIMNIGL